MSAMKLSASCKLRNGACESKLSGIKQEIKSVWQEACTSPDYFHNYFCSSTIDDFSCSRCWLLDSVPFNLDVMQRCAMQSIWKTLLNQSY